MTETSRCRSFGLLVAMAVVDLVLIAYGSAYYTMVEPGESEADGRAYFLFYTSPGCAWDKGVDHRVRPLFRLAHIFDRTVRYDYWANEIDE